MLSRRYMFYASLLISVILVRRHIQGTSQKSHEPRHLSNKINKGGNPASEKPVTEAHVVQKVTGKLESRLLSSAEKTTAMGHLENAKPILDMEKAPAMDRDLSGVTVDLYYKLNVPSNWWANFATPSYNSLMHSLYGRNIWEDPGLSDHISHLGIKSGASEIHGSPLREGILLDLITTIKPKVFLEVGVFRGSTSTKIAKIFQTSEGMEDSYVVSLDTWLLDLRFVWGGPKSSKGHQHKYFKMDGVVAGGSHMLYIFLSNCIFTKTTDRIIPLPTASQNGAMALLAHGVRPEIIYIDASHSNPDVFIDYENFYTILAPGGAMAFDDLGIPAVHTALESLTNRYGLTLVKEGNQGYITKPK